MNTEHTSIETKQCLRDDLRRHPGQYTSWLLFFCLFTFTFFLALGLCISDAQAQGLVPSLRVERVTRLAESYSAVPTGALICSELSEPPAIDANPSDWPAAQDGETLTLGQDEKLRAFVRSGWDLSNFYLTADIQDDTLLPAASDDVTSGDFLTVTLWVADPANAASKNEEAEDAGHTFAVANSSDGPLLLRVRDAKFLTDSGLLAIADSPGHRVIEMRLPWTELAPMAPFPASSLRLAVRLEDRDSPDDIEPAVLDNSEHESRLVLVSGTPQISKAASISMPIGFLQVRCSMASLSSKLPSLPRLCHYG